jgi:hypothetical protein
MVQAGKALDDFIEQSVAKKFKLKTPQFQLALYYLFKNLAATFRKRRHQNRWWKL